MARRICSLDDLQGHSCRLLILLSDDPDVIKAWTDVSEMIISDPMIQVPGSPTQVIEYDGSQVEPTRSTFQGPFTREHLLEYCLDRTVQSFKEPTQSVRGLLQYTSKF